VGDYIIGDGMEQMRAQKTIDTLKSLPVWGLWRKERRGEDIVKMPYTSGGIKRASSTALEDWCIYSDLVRPEGFFEALRVPEGYIFVDFDHVGSHFDDAELAPLLEALGGYQEVSQSGDGYHVIVQGDGIPDRHRCRLERDVEVYTKARFVALTWDCRGLGRDREPLEWSELAEMLGSVGVDLEGKQREKPLQPSAKDCREVGGDEVPRAASSAPTDSQILARALKRSKFKALHEQGDLSAYGQDHSKAVFAWLAIVAYYTKDKAQVDRLFKASALYAGDWARGKWERLQDADQWTKIEMSVGDASWEPLGAGSVEDAFEVVEDAKPVVVTPPLAGPDAYWAVVEDAYKPKSVVRDIFLGQAALEVMDGLNGASRWVWLSSREVKATLKSCLREMGASARASRGLLVDGAEDFLIRWERESAEWGLRLTVPDWDGVDRIGALAQSLTLKDSRLSASHADYFVKDWTIKCWAKLYNPKIQNRMLLLQGQQGIGKDSWAMALAGGFGAHFGVPAVQNPQYLKEVELARVVADKAVCLFDEFDKLKGAEALIKSLITKRHFDVEVKYENAPGRVEHRCSYIGTTNTNIFSDTTGNRRFLLFELLGDKGNGISFSFPDPEGPFAAQWQAQVLAQGFALYQEHQTGYGSHPAAEEAEALMATIQSENTPEDQAADLVESFITLLDKRSKYRPGWQKFFLASEIAEDFLELAKGFQRPLEDIKATLRKAGCYKQIKRSGHQPKRVWGRSSDFADAETVTRFFEQDDCPF